MHQPVYLGDIVKALFNGMETQETHLVNAVGPDAISQEDMIKFFLDFKGKPFKPLHIPKEVAMVVAKHCPKGRFAPYAVGLLGHLDEEKPQPLCKRPFEKLVGSPLKSLRDIYPKTLNAQIIFPPSPVLDHLIEYIIHIAKNREARQEFLFVAKKYGPDLVINAIRAYLECK